MTISSPQPAAPLPLYRLTLSPAAVAAAVQSSKTAKILFAVLRPDGKYDAGVSLANASLLKQLAGEGENLSDALIRIVGGKE